MNRLLALAVAAALRYGADADWTRPDAAFLGSAATITAAAGVAVGAFIRALSQPGPGARGSSPRRSNVLES